MLKSVKLALTVCLVALVILTAVTVGVIVTNIQATSIFNTPTVFAVGVLVVLACVIAVMLEKSILYPIKKIDKSMRGFTDGKNIDIKTLYGVTNYKEINQLIATYSEMVKDVIKKKFELNSEESKTAIILERMDDGVIAFSLQRQVIHMNTSAKKYVGVNDGDNTYEKVCRKLGAKVDFEKIIYTPNYKNIEEKVTLKDNVLNVVLIPFYSEKLMPMGVIMIIKNITESERLENMRKEFVANVSHELKTPLSSIKGYSETIVDRELEVEEIKRFAMVINNEANRMDRIVADLLQLTRFDNKKEVTNKTTFSMDDLVKQVVENMQYAAKEKKHNLKCIVNIIPPAIFADKDAIQQVAINILSNSIKYTPDGGEITVYVGAAGTKAYAKFVDNGIGIPQKDLNRIFERFYRVDKARSRQLGGTGLGLSIVKEIVEAHDGTIEIKSEVGVGTEVIVTLPTIKQDNG